MRRRNNSGVEGQRDAVKIKVHYVHHTDKAVLVIGNNNLYWVPRSIATLYEVGANQKEVAANNLKKFDAVVLLIPSEFWDRCKPVESESTKKTLAEFRKGGHGLVG